MSVELRTVELECTECGQTYEEYLLPDEEPWGQCPVCTCEHTHYSADGWADGDTVMIKCDECGASGWAVVHEWYPPKEVRPRP
jgi:hypothetical protein